MVEHDWYGIKKKHKTALSGEARQVPIKFPLKIKRLFYTLFSLISGFFFFFSVAKLYFTENYFDPLLIWAVRGL